MLKIVVVFLVIVFFRIVVAGVGGMEWVVKFCSSRS